MVNSSNDMQRNEDIVFVRVGSHLQARPAILVMTPTRAGAGDLPSAQREIGYASPGGSMDRGRNVQSVHQRDAHHQSAE